MTLETLLNRPFPAPSFIQMGREAPRRPHWVGDKGQAPSRPGQPGGGRPEGPSSFRQDPRGYRQLATVTLGEVQDAMNYFAGQLVPSPYEAWVAPGYFCRFDLVRRRDGRPPAVFGRVKTCFPGDGHVQNIEDVELYLPSRDAAPDIVLLHTGDIRAEPDSRVQSFCIRVQLFLSQDEQAEFQGREELLLQQGLHPEFSTAYLDVLEMTESGRESQPWLYVIGSRWYAGIPDSVKSEVREKVRSLMQWNRLIFNYHPEALAGDVRSLNRELGFKPGFTDVFLIEPETPNQTAAIVAAAFERIFLRPEGYAPSGSR